MSDTSVGSTLSSQLLNFSAEERSGEVHEPVQSPGGLLDCMTLLCLLCPCGSALSPGSYLLHRGEVHSGARPLE